eukprot:6020763-Amphidinium_carterae.1
MLPWEGVAKRSESSRICPQMVLIRDPGTEGRTLFRVASVVFVRLNRQRYITVIALIKFLEGDCLGAVLRERLYVFGGLEKFTSLNSAECWDPMLRTWLSLPHMPCGRVNASAAVLLS